MTATLVLQPLWNNGRCTYAVKYRGVSSDERLEIEHIADWAGFIRDGDIWTPSDPKDMIELRRLLSEASFNLKYDVPEDGPFDLQRLHLSTRTRMQLESLQGFRLHDLSGWTPVQGCGVVDRSYWYFRARGNYWRFEVGGNEGRTRSPRWWHDELWPSPTGFEAGYMSDEDAVCCILKAVDFYRDGDNSRFLPDHPDYERTILDGWSSGAISLLTASIRLSLTGEEIVERTKSFGIEVPYTAKWELPYVAKQKIRRLRLRS